jgi:hypothetical protein
VYQKRYIHSISKKDYEGVFKIVVTFEKRLRRSPKNREAFLYNDMMQTFVAGYFIVMGAIIMVGVLYLVFG